MFANPSTTEIYSFLKTAKTIAVVGISEREDRASRYVSEYMQRAGYTIYPVNPNLDDWHGLKAYDSVAEVPVTVDIVDVFRRSEFVLPVAENAVEAGVGVLWLQQGIVNDGAAELAAAAGLSVVMDTCIMVAHRSMKLGF
ncbi:MAG: CoA-binding protein [Chloroflexi bacterium]|nr:CoA-binding protein [Chloroflexota bacterium]MCI0871292.1 CoA-binding protein [Chloroflexota bacterium]